ncbi:MAG: hypothetical protein ACTSRI_08735 [Promethearchaeota archaeon]
MLEILIILIISAFVIVIFIIYWKLVKRSRLRKKRVIADESTREASDESLSEVEKERIKNKLKEISQIIVDTEEKLTETHFKKKELKIIRKAEDEFISFTAGFKAAMPADEKERKQDLVNLKEAISILESFDDSTYKVGKKIIDAGTGMFYDKTSRYFLKIINEQGLNEFKLIPVQRLKYYAFKSIKNVRNSDFLPILKVMKDTKLINDIIKINSIFHLIAFTEEQFNFSIPEKVLLTFAYDENLLTKKKLMKLTEWKEKYLNNVLNGLINKGVIKVSKERIIVEGFGKAEEREKWNEIIQEQIQKEKEKEQQMHKRQFERQKLFKQQIEEKEKINQEVIIETIDDVYTVEEEFPKIKFDKKPTVKTLTQINKVPEKIDEKEKQVIKDKDDLLGAMEALDRESKFSEGNKIKSKKKSNNFLKLPSNLEELVSEIILSYHEKFSVVNGGLIQHEKLSEYINQELENTPDELIKKTLEQLIKLKMIKRSIKIGKHVFYLFNDINFNENNIKFIEFAANKKPLKKTDFMKGLNWDEEKTLVTMKDLQEKGVLRIEESNQIFIPGIVQKKKN